MATMNGGSDDIRGIPVGRRAACAVCWKEIVMLQRGWVHVERYQLHLARPLGEDDTVALRKRRTMTVRKVVVGLVIGIVALAAIMAAGSTRH